MRSTLVVFLLIVAACDDSSSELPSDVDDYVTVWRATYCDYQVRCGVFPDVATCQVQDRTLAVDPDVLAAVHAGAVEWNGDVATQCLAALTQRACDSTAMADRFWDLPCYGTFSGTRHAGETCAIGGECISGECEFQGGGCTDGLLCCSGTCKGDVAAPLAMIGESCRAAPCAEGYCTPQTRVCRTLKDIGGEFCDGDVECAYGSACVNRECVAMAGSGEPCQQSAERPCKLIGETCHTASGNCEASQQIGGTCTDYYDCAANLNCDDTGHCADLRPGVGESCELFGVCQSPNLCENTEMGIVCVEPKPDGSFCNGDDSECASQRCDLGTGTCSSEPCI